MADGTTRWAAPFSITRSRYSRSLWPDTVCDPDCRPLSVKNRHCGVSRRMSKTRLCRSRHVPDTQKFSSNRSRLSSTNESQQYIERVGRISMSVYLSLEVSWKISTGPHSKLDRGMVSDTEREFLLIAGKNCKGPWLPLVLECLVYWRNEIH